MFSSILPSAPTALRFPSQNGSSKNHPSQASKGYVRVINHPNPGPAPYPYTRSDANFELGYAPQAEHQGNWYPSSAMPRSTAKYSIYPSALEDTFIYEQSTCSKSDILCGEDYEVLSANAFSPALTTDSTVTLRAPTPADDLDDRRPVASGSRPGSAPVYPQSLPPGSSALISRSISSHQLLEPADALEERRRIGGGVQGYPAGPIRVPVSSNGMVTQQLMPPAGYVAYRPDFDTASTISEFEVNERDRLAKINAEYNSASTGAYYANQGPGSSTSSDRRMSIAPQNPSSRDSPPMVERIPSKHPGSSALSSATINRKPPQGYITGPYDTNTAISTSSSSRSGFNGYPPAQDGPDAISRQRSMAGRSSGPSSDGYGVPRVGSDRSQESASKRGSDSPTRAGSPQRDVYGRNLSDRRDVPRGSSQIPLPDEARFMQGTLTASPTQLRSSPTETMRNPSSSSREGYPSSSDVPEKERSRSRALSISNSSAPILPFPVPAQAMSDTAAYNDHSSHSRMEPVRKLSDGDKPFNTNPITMRGNPLGVARSAGSVVSMNSTASHMDHPEPQRRYSDGDRPSSSGRNSANMSRSVRWTENLVCPSPVINCQRRKGWFNRRGYVMFYDQLWTNDGAFKPPPSGQEYPPDLDDYPEQGEGWMNEEGTRIDVDHRLVPKMPLRSALKQPKAQLIYINPVV
ncbi:hypothetical protein CVT24_006467 [Panaeolus cyanescens]|uniref:Uncharacterized protein n=1 Tax=Panaeolus cyanescens TaxID=181874 RepID=A0A409VZ47_9AGAR|nr:hypothetical protein CVT24_006467 [Panaeolus cyanescens]